MSENKTPGQTTSQGQSTSQISQIFGPIKLLPGESEAAYRAGLDATLKELGASTHLQIYLAEKIFQSLWWMRRYEVQKQSSIVNAMVKLSSQYNTTETTNHNLTVKLQAHMWDAQDVITFIKQKGYTPESLTAKAMSEVREEIQKNRRPHRPSRQVAWPVTAVL